MNPEKTFTSKLGTTRVGERTRIWLEGARLIAHGFEPGTRVLKTWVSGGALVLTVDSVGDLSRANYATVSGKGAKPIIDITGAQVAEWFGSETHVTVTYRAGRIVIRKASV